MISIGISSLGSQHSFQDERDSQNEIHSNDSTEQYENTEL